MSYIFPLIQRFFTLFFILFFATCCHVDNVSGHIFIPAGQGCAIPPPLPPTLYAAHPPTTVPCNWLCG